MKIFHMLSIVIAGCFFQLPMTVSAQPGLPPLTDSIVSDILKETRGLQVILPKDHVPGSPKKYEVVYILDGEWYHELVPFAYNFAASAGYCPKSIFVLIRNRYVNGRNLRDRDFSPERVQYDSISGGAPDFYDFVTREVVPYIEKKYPASGQRSLVGSSFSGLFSVYAFLKDPAFFRSFVASDPNLNFDNDYVTRLADSVLRILPPSPGTLFIAGLTTSYRDMGIAGFDSILRARAPGSLHWKSVYYPDESHYSVQLKAFYDGFRFSHFGYGDNAPEFHPMKGMIDRQRSVIVFFLNQNPSARFTRNGKEPDTTSELMLRGQSTSVAAPAQLRVKTFANRESYVNEWTGTFTMGRITPAQSSGRSAKTGLRYALFRGTDTTMRNMITSKPDQTGTADSLFKVKSVLSRPPSYVVIEGIVDIPQDGEYIFFANGYDSVHLTFAGKVFFETYGRQSNPSQSYVVSVAKGKYPMRLVIVRKNAAREPYFSIFQSKQGNEKWWEHPWINF